jgi:hypothetical protein
MNKTHDASRDFTSADGKHFKGQNSLPELSSKIMKQYDLNQVNHDKAVVSILPKTP